MTDDRELDSLPAVERFVLERLAELARRERTPAQTHEVRRACKERAEERDAVGTVSEADVLRSLYRLESRDLVTEIPPESRSPVGKGRPFYEPAVDPDAVLEDG
ncbi:hypothetical protein [Salinilacihabitans rarus]|uniref:hypothetical protein n=1 Tax=Salinilacihabitans rarus TaxID=2961596 RepID=UPI0020C8533D|nr:hypothetical protein [Salinilacihabitans rarus]